ANGGITGMANPAFGEKTVAVEGPFKTGLEGLAVFRKNVLCGDLNAPFGLQRVVTEDLVVAERAKGAIVDEVEIPNAQLGRVNRHLQAFFAGSEGFTGSDTLADVANGAGNQGAFSSLERAKADLHRYFGAVLAPSMELQANTHAPWMRRLRI